LEPDKLTFYAPMFEVRYKSITQLIRECAASQVLELASGYSLRGLDLTQRGSLHYVETDLRDVVATKLELLTDVRRRHNIAPNPLHVITAADVLDLDQLRAATAGFKRDQPLMVLCEGLVGYLTREETGRLTTNVHSLLTEFSGGWWIVPDFAFKTEIRECHPRGSDSGRPSRGSRSVSSMLRPLRTAPISNPSSTVLVSICRCAVR
jgi:O-methyltransferase involved in polyketide biosynthesis